MSADKDREARRQVLHNRLRDIDADMLLADARLKRLARDINFAINESQETWKMRHRLADKKLEVLNELDELDELNDSYEGDTKRTKRLT